MFQKKSENPPKFRESAWELEQRPNKIRNQIEMVELVEVCRDETDCPIFLFNDILYFHVTIKYKEIKIT